MSRFPRISSGDLTNSKVGFLNYETPDRQMNGNQRDEKFRIYKFLIFARLFIFLNRISNRNHHSNNTNTGVAIETGAISAQDIRRMLSYRHAFHAGNPADVLKHTLLVHALDYMVQKEKPLLYGDTHAGAGMYRLDDGFATMNREYEAGVGRLQASLVKDPVLLRYLEVVRECCPVNGELSTLDLPASHRACYAPGTVCACMRFILPIMICLPGRWPRTDG
jgi:hypothetical protein